MFNINFYWIGYCAATNQFWGVFIDTNNFDKLEYFDRKFYCVWGYVGKKINFKKTSIKISLFYDIDKLIEKKMKNYYTKVVDLNDVWPNFSESFNQQFIVLKLSED